MHWIVIGALVAAASVGLGAFGAHALEPRLDSGELALWETAARYLMYSALGVLAMGIVSRSTPIAVDWPATALTVGGLLFAGTVAALALGGPRWLGAVTPVGGALMIVGWIGFAWVALRA